jgi:3-oxo-5-alpha-steroid 4-dehydrogenase 1
VSGERALFGSLLIGWTALAAVAFVALFFVPAPYGRYATGAERWTRPQLPARWGWFLMELPATALFVALWAVGRHRAEPAAIALGLLWLGHYAHRDIVYPLSLPDGVRPMPLAVVAMGFGFQLVNVYFNARWLFELGPGYPTRWLLDARFLVGALLFFIGSWVNRAADAELRRLKRSSDGYALPKGGLYRWISCPNYFGEIVLWSGWAIAAWNLPALSFALWTIANLAPRARRHHRWYRERFAGYPTGRRALLPGIW